jgi:hypothetical protein
MTERLQDDLRGMETAIMEAWHTSDDMKTVMNFNGEDAYLHMDPHIADKVVCDKLIEEFNMVRKMHDIRMTRLYGIFSSMINTEDIKT